MSEPASSHESRFRSAPTTLAHRHAYHLVLAAVVLALMALPAMIHHALPGRDVPRYANNRQAVAEQVLTFGDWPLYFRALDACAYREDAAVDGIAQFDCPDAVVNVMGMSGVEDTDAGKSRALERAVRAINFMEPEAFVNPRREKRFLRSLQQAGVSQQWGTDYYRTVDANGTPVGGVAGRVGTESTPRAIRLQDPSMNDEFSRSVLTRTFGLFHPAESGGLHLVAVQITAMGVPGIQDTFADFLAATAVSDSGDSVAAADTRGAA